ncbi:MAG: hypothetical protein DRJ69_06745 [Thermoprotei archaeon]|nr:MAG: hypothetical protein DRJ69_06745 [Thermoprotei archaeon]
MIRRLARWFRRKMGRVNVRRRGITPPHNYKLLEEVYTMPDRLDKNHPLIRGRLVDEAAEQVRKSCSGFDDCMKKAMDWVVGNIEYDEVHASASVNWRSSAYTYMTAEETIRLRRGICGEMSLVLLGILRRLNIPSYLARPSFSHIAVIAEKPWTGEKFLLDPTFNMIVELGLGNLPRYARSEESRYVIGPITLDEFAGWTVNRRKKLGRRVKRDITAEEAIDLEYARACAVPPHGTKLGYRMLRRLMDAGACEEVFDPDDAESIALFMNLVSECPRPEDKIDAGCYARAWSMFRGKLVLVGGEEEWWPTWHWSW